MPSLPALAVVFALAAGAAGAGLAQQPNRSASTLREVLKSSTDRTALEQAASALARSHDPDDLQLLGQLLRSADFLGRLDDQQDLKTFHLSRVMAVLAGNPSPQTAELCLTLADDPVYLAGADRESFLLKVLAEVKPMSERTAALFQRANGEGYYGFNVILLAANSSPVALRLLESMLLDKDVPIEDRLECVHDSIVPHRMEVPILRLADRIFSRTSERALANGVIESVFDFRQEWFGIESGISAPPPWTSASTDSLRAALQLAEKAEARPGLSPSLHKKVASARETIAQALGQH